MAIIQEECNNKFMWTKLDYIHLNPVRLELSRKLLNYVYSSASIMFRFRIIENKKRLIVEVINLNNFTKYNEYEFDKVGT
jgi:hypothetical protein